MKPHGEPAVARPRAHGDRLSGAAGFGRRRAINPPRRQRGIALLVAILLVALGTIVAAAIAYENAMTARRGAATYAFDEALLIAQGAEALAAYGLREVARADPKYTYPAQPWAKPLGPIEVVPGVMLEASLEDMQGRFNLNSLVQDDGKPDPQALQAFQQLLEKCGLEPKWANFAVDWIDPGIDPMYPEGAEDSVYMGQNPPYRTANMPITSTTELLALPGFGRDRYIKLAPFITALPRDAKLNVCSASAQVLNAFLGISRTDFDPEVLAKNRLSANTCFPKKADYAAAFDSQQSFQTAQDKFIETSGYFRLSTLVTIGSTEFNLYSLLSRENGGMTRPILRSYSPD